jgi:plastocyanin
MKKLVLLIFLLIAGVFTMFECKKQSTDAPVAAIPGANEVWIQNMAFNPSSITISVNTTIKWTNKDGVAHTVTSNNGVFDSGNISANGTYSHQFTTAGTYPYHCTIHPSMTGTIIVK